MIEFLSIHIPGYLISFLLLCAVPNRESIPNYIVKSLFISILSWLTVIWIVWVYFNELE